ncbi:bifunctional (p)ppGpp synthetase/guanosine-3',5'-bis(diphosphate) 3'-pyrophosphohydrolase [soil metagenome]
MDHDRLPTSPAQGTEVPVWPAAEPPPLSRAARVRQQVSQLPSITAHLAQALASSLDRATELLPAARRRRNNAAHLPPAAGATDEHRGVVTFASLATKLAEYLTPAEVAQVREAYRFSDAAHLGQFRASGDPYISHPLAVADLCAGWHLDTQGLMAALLHDVIEDQGVNKAELIEKFGGPVADLVDGLSKLDKLEFRSQEDAQAENFRKMLFAMSRDVRVILVKLADRLHNMRTLDAVPPPKRRRISRETIEIYAPIAHRLGLNQVFRELQDLAFANLHPMRYATLHKAVLAARGNRREVVGKILEAVKTTLPANGVAADVSGREKTLFGIYSKMREKRLSFSQVLDIYGFRVVVETRAQCYAALGVLHGLYKPVHSKIKDYIAVPKVNGYQSLHTTLIGPFGTPVEFQIRTEEMHRVAESGVAAHWLYKSDDASLSDLQRKTHIWLQSLIEMQNQVGDASEFLETVKVDLFPDAVYVFTPRSNIVSLPRGSTPIDFAYQIHTDVGNRATGARVNGITVPLRTELGNGDVVEILTAPNAKPSPNWLAFVRTAKARFEIRHALRTTSYAESVALGEQLLSQAVVAMGADMARFSEDEWERALRSIGVKTREELFADIGLARRMATVTARRIVGGWGGGSVESVAEPAPGVERPRVFIRGTEGMAVQLAPCCLPIPGDDIVGYLRKGHGMIVHTSDCPQALRLRSKDPDWWIDDVAWSGDLAHHFDARLQVMARNDQGALGRIAAEISKADSNISRVTTEAIAPEPGVVIMEFTVQVADRQHLANVLRQLKARPEVLRVQRLRG